MYAIRTVIALCILSVCVFCAGIGVAQSSSRLAAKYKQFTVFEIRPGIEARPTYSGDGNVCRMVIEKLQYRDSENVDFDPTIPLALANQLVDEIAPADERGKASPFFDSKSFIAGGTSFIKQDYTNVSVAMYSGGPSERPMVGPKIIVITWPKRVCHVDVAE